MLDRLAETGIDFVVPGPIDQRTGGYIYDRRIVLGLGARGVPVRV
ncbi:MAG: glycosyltransferase family 1 protein, partial [Proteobacteria bacterium]|nr:glycosyltransferase family 1 protein [Pseudomonadota bacterium]